MSTTLGSITLPNDLMWVDEFTWSPCGQQVDVSFNGALIIEESAQQAGRPMTLQGGQEQGARGPNYYGVATRAVVQSLYDLAAAPLETALTLTLEDEREFDVRFRYDQGAPVEARAWKPIAEYGDEDFYTITLRLMQV